MFLLMEAFFAANEKERDLSRLMDNASKRREQVAAHERLQCRAQTRNKKSLDILVCNRSCLARPKENTSRAYQPAFHEASVFMAVDSSIFFPSLWSTARKMGAIGRLSGNCRARTTNKNLLDMLPRFPGRLTPRLARERRKKYAPDDRLTAGNLRAAKCFFIRPPIVTVP